MILAIPRLASLFYPTLIYPTLIYPALIYPALKPILP